MFSFKYSPRPNTLASKRLPDDVPEEEKTRRIVALQALQRRDSDRAASRRRSGTTVEVLVDAREPAARLGAVGPDARQHGRELPGPAGLDRATGAGARSRGAGPNSLRGEAVAA